MVTKEKNNMYKCSAKASLVLDQMRSRCQEDTQTNNKWHGKSGNYMYIMGRENADGKATGVVHKIADDSSHKLCDHSRSCQMVSSPGSRVCQRQTGTMR